MQTYSKLQISSISKISNFIDLGVPDWSMSYLPALYDNLINQESLLLDDGLTHDELKKLHKSQSNLIEICDKLSSYRINETFGHADFHDKNILINPDTQQTTLIDLGEVVITHPFFSLHNCLYRAKENFSLTESQHYELQQAALLPWLEIESEEHLLEILSIINQCWAIHSVLGEYRLMTSVNQPDFSKLQRQGRLANNLRHWLKHDQTI